jgi:hypothetical protein
VAAQDSQWHDLQCSSLQATGTSYHCHLLFCFLERWRGMSEPEVLESPFRVWIAPGWIPSTATCPSSDPMDRRYRFFLCY